MSGQLHRLEPDIVPPDVVVNSGRAGVGLYNHRVEVRQDFLQLLQAGGPDPIDLTIGEFLVLASQATGNITITLDEESEDTNFFTSQEIRTRMGSTPGVLGLANKPFKLLLRWQHDEESGKVVFFVMKGVKAELFSFAVYIASSARI
ncbi:hypothetical protein LTR41_001061 [Exophiala xenobiotica]|nr:hypothetical protein LTR41_001061 [Exophiala xenobiotica]